MIGEDSSPREFDAEVSSVKMRRGKRRKRRRKKKRRELRGRN